MAASRQVTPKKRGPGRKWRKGESGNPNGRPPDAELALVRKLTKDLFEPYVPDAVDALVHICREGKSESAIVAAAETIIERARGKAPLSVEEGGADTTVFEFVLRRNDNPPAHQADDPADDPSLAKESA